MVGCEGRRGQGGWGKKGQCSKPTVRISSHFILFAVYIITLLSLMLTFITLILLQNNSQRLLTSVLIVTGIMNSNAYLQFFVFRIISRADNTSNNNDNNYNHDYDSNNNR